MGGEHTSLALDSAGYPHISYYDQDNGGLKYAYRDGSGWRIQIVDSTVVGCEHSSLSLALDGRGYPHIGYHDCLNGDLKYGVLEYRIYLPLVLRNR